MFICIYTHMHISSCVYIFLNNSVSSKPTKLFLFALVLLLQVKSVSIGYFNFKQSLLTSIL